jgi:hypothetical protein
MAGLRGRILSATITHAKKSDLSGCATSKIIAPVLYKYHTHHIPFFEQSQIFAYFLLHTPHPYSCHVLRAHLMGLQLDAVVKVIYT